MRYNLRSREVLKWIMEHPGRGAPYSVRTLADATGISRTQIGNLLSGKKLDLEVEDAHRVAEALGVAILVLFAPPASPQVDDPSTNRSPIRKE